MITIILAILDALNTGFNPSELYVGTFIIDIMIVFSVHDYFMEKGVDDEK